VTRLRLMLLTPAPDEPRFAQIAQQWADRLAGALATARVVAETRRWTQADDLSGFDGVSPLLAWSYHQHLDDWLERLDRLAACGLPVINPVATLTWNTTKTYLADLEAAGVPIVPTLFTQVLTPEDLAEAHARFGPSLVAKPQVSGGSFATVRIEAGRPVRGGPEGPAMLQPFLPAIAAEGELSLLYFGGAFSHAIGKRARAGDFRVQYQFGGTYGAITPPTEAFDLAERALAAAGRPLTYARIDLIRDPGGRLRLMELEAIEPDLYLEHARDGGEAFAWAMRGALEEQLA
jgi:glutathione synthase/RimK-type ligase-like ATP-grasp enzyme